jgi:hypothetical protein
VIVSCRVAPCATVWATPERQGSGGDAQSGGSLRSVGEIGAQRAVDQVREPSFEAAEGFLIHAEVIRSVPGAAQSLEHARWRSQLSFSASSIVGTGGMALVIREWLWLRYCRYIHDQAVARKQDPDAAEMIRAASGGRLGHSPKRPALPSPLKSDDTSLAA